MFGTLLRQRPVDADPHLPEPVLPQAVQLGLGVVGTAMVLVSLGLFLAPDLLIPVWPWTLTPLTARVTSAMFMLPGIVGLGIAADPRWSVARFVLEAQVVSIALILGGAFRDGSDIDDASPVAWVFLGGLAALLVALVAHLVAMRRPAVAVRAA